MITLLFLIVLVSILIKIDFNNSKPVYLEYNDNPYEQFYLNVENVYITTKNINKYFKDIKILGVLPLLSTLYQTYYQVDWYYFNDLNNNMELQILEEKVSNVLKDKNFIKEVENIHLNGVRIKTILVETTYQDIKKLQLKLPKLVIV